MDIPFPVLYAIVRNDLQTMNPGKAEAHSGHAAVAFVEKTLVVPLLAGTAHKDIDPLVWQWRTATTQGFGTQINLNANFKQMKTIVEVSNSLGFVAELVTDTSYPYELPTEAANLIPESTDTLPRIYKGATTVLFRNEITAAYVFGDKNDSMLEAVIGRFNLKP